MKRIAQVGGLALLIFSGLACRATLPFRQEVPDGLKDLLPNSGEVVPGVYRSGQPALTTDTYRKLQQAGLRRILTFRWEEDVLAAERKLVEESGMAFDVIPWSGFDEPSPEIVDRFFEWMEGDKPALLHCIHGQERTGLLVACYRVAKQGWTADRAYDEMKQFHFRWFWYGHLARFLYRFSEQHGQKVAFAPSPLDQLRTNFLFQVYQMRHAFTAEHAAGLPEDSEVRAP